MVMKRAPGIFDRASAWMAMLLMLTWTASAGAAGAVFAGASGVGRVAGSGVAGSGVTGSDGVLGAATSVAISTGDRRAVRIERLARSGGWPVSAYGGLSIAAGTVRLGPTRPARTGGDGGAGSFLRFRLAMAP